MPVEHVAGAPVNGAARSGKRCPHLRVFFLWSRGCGLRKQVTRRPAQKHTYCVTTSAVKYLMRHVHLVFMARLAWTAGLHEWLVRQAMHVQPLSQWKTKKYYIFWVCFCSLRYPAYKSHVPYCHLWPVRLYNIFTHYLKNGENLEKKIEHKMCVDFLYISHSKNRARYDQKCKFVLLWSTRYSCQILIKRVLMRDSWKILKYWISLKSVQREPSCSMRTDGDMTG
jgi:hypothetical protein